jgi:hypothetical protein
MEPADLNASPDRDDARFEAWLRQPSTPLADAGFSARVMAALPPPAVPQQTGFSRRVACILGGIIGTGITLYGIGWHASWTVGSWTPPATDWDTQARQLLDPVVLGALALAGASVLYAFRERVRQRLIQ